MFIKWYQVYVEGECDPFGACLEMVPFNVEGECDLFGACSENGTISC